MTGLAFVKPRPRSSAPPATELFNVRGARMTLGLVGAASEVGAEASVVLGCSGGGWDWGCADCSVEDVAGAEAA